MKRTDAPHHVGNLFQSGNPLTGQRGTRVDHTWLNAVQEELINAIELAGIVIDPDDNTQLAQAIDFLIARHPAIGARFTQRWWLAGDTQVDLHPDSGGSQLAALRKLLTAVEAHKPHRGFLLGDLVDRGAPVPGEQAGDYLFPDLHKDLRDYLPSLHPGNTHAINGNHGRNYGSTADDPYAQSFEAYKTNWPAIRWLTLLGNICTIGIGTDGPSTAGWIDERSFAWLTDKIRRHQHYNIVLLMHQPISGAHERNGVPFVEASSEEAVQLGSDRFTDMLAQPGHRVDMIGHGHIHSEYEDQLFQKTRSYGANTVHHVSFATGVNWATEMPGYDLVASFIDWRADDTTATLTRHNIETEQDVDAVTLNFPYPVRLDAEPYLDTARTSDPDLMERPVNISVPVRREYDEVSGKYVPVARLHETLALGVHDGASDNVGVGQGPGIFFRTPGAYSNAPGGAQRQDGLSGAFGMARAVSTDMDRRGAFVWRGHDLPMVRVDVSDSGSGEGAFAIAVVEGGVVSRVLPIRGGSGYTSGTVSVTLPNYDGVTSPASVAASVRRGEITGYIVNDGGAGYPGTPVEGDLTDWMRLGKAGLHLFDASAPADHTKYSQFATNFQGGREVMSLRSLFKKEEDGAWADFYGKNDSMNPGKVILGTATASGIAVPNINLDANTPNTSYIDLGHGSGRQLRGDEFRPESVDLLLKVADAASGGNESPTAFSTAKATRIGDVVTVTVAIYNIDTTGMTGTNELYITGLPSWAWPAASLPVATILSNVDTDPGGIIQIDSNGQIAIAEAVKNAPYTLLDVYRLNSGTADIRFAGSYVGAQ